MTSPRSVQCLLTFIALMFAGSPGARAAQTDKASAGPIVELPKMIVTDDRIAAEPEAWRYAEIPGFEILSNATDRATQRLLTDFQFFNIAIDIVWRGIQPKRSVPISLIICGSGGKFDAFVPGEENQTDTGRASLFLHDHDRAALVIDFEAKTISISSLQAAGAGAVVEPESEDIGAGAAGVSGNEFEVDHNRQLYREYLRFLLSRVEPRMPAWAEEGLAQLFMGMQVSPKSILFGQLQERTEGPASGGAEDNDFNQALAKRKFMAMDEFFAVERDSPTAMNPLGSRWAKQAQGLVHMWLYGENQKYQKGFRTFLGRLQHEPASEQLFKECFNMSYDKMLTNLRVYVGSAFYKSYEFKAKGGKGIPTPEPLALRDATQSEIGRIKGEAQALAGHQELARAEMLAPYARGERDPKLLAALGLYEHEAGDDARAKKFLEAAVTAKVVRPEVYLLLARQRYADALAKAGPNGNFSAAEISGIVDLLYTARHQPPHLAAIYELIAETRAHSETKISREDAIVLIQGAMLFPARLKLVYAAAVFANDAGEFEPAHALADHGIKNALDATTRARFAELKATLPPLPVPAKPDAPAVRVRK